MSALEALHRDENGSQRDEDTSPVKDILVNAVPVTTSLEITA